MGEGELHSALKQLRAEANRQCPEALEGPGQTTTLIARERASLRDGLRSVPVPLTLDALGLSRGEREQVVATHPMTVNNQPQTPYVLAIDIGSSSVRATVYDAHANAVSGLSVATPHVTPTTPDGGAADDALVLAGVVERTIDDILTLAGDAAAKIVAVGLDSFVGNILGLDKAGNPTTPVYTYADTRSLQEVAQMRRDLDAVDVHQRTGVTLHTAYAPARLLWVRANEPKAWAETVRWTDFATYLYGRWFGEEAACSSSVASWSGLLNRNTGDWDTKLLAYTGISSDQLPRLADYSDTMSRLAPAYAAKWPTLSQVPFTLAVGDGAAANVGEGCSAPGATALTVGTTGAVRAGVPIPLDNVPRGLSVYNLSKQRILLGGAVTDAGGLFAWMRDTLDVPDPATLETELSALKPDGHGLTVLPFLRGERSPGWLDNATGAVIGLRASTTPADIVRAGLESVAYRFALIADRLATVVKPEPEIVVGGGAAQSSPTWLQMFADVLDRTVAESGEPETTSRGSAILALHSAGVIDSLDDLPAQRGRRYTPNPASTDAYRVGLERHHTLYHSLLDLPDSAGSYISECDHDPV
jgi:gluconokinase